MPVYLFVFVVFLVRVYDVCVSMGTHMELMG